MIKISVINNRFGSIRCVCLILLFLLDLGEHNNIETISFNRYVHYADTD